MRPKMARRLFLLLAATIALAVSCGGRNLEDFGGPAASPVGGNHGSGGNATGGQGATGGTIATGGNGEGGTTEGGGGGGINPIDCIGCIAQSCPEVLSCVTNPECIQGIGCTVVQCLGGGQPDLLCIADCFGGDIEAAMEAIQVITCVFGECGDSCGNFFPMPF